MQLISRNILIAMAYAAIGILSTSLGLSTQFALPFWIPAGVAVGAVLLWGRAVLPAVFLGAIAVNAFLYAQMSADVEPFLLVLCALGVSLGATVQAWLGATLGERVSIRDASLAQWRTSMLFIVVIGPVASVVNSTLGPVLRRLIDAAPSEQLTQSMVYWWVGDSLGAILTVPVMLALFRTPNHDWRTRRTTIIPPIVLIAVIIVVMDAAIVSSEADRRQTRFVSDTRDITDSVRINLTRYESLLTAAERFYVASDRKDEAAFRTFVRGPVMKAESMVALAFLQRVTDDQRAQFEATEARRMPRGITERSGRVFVPARQRREYAPVTLVEPVEAFPNTIGFDVLSDPIRGPMLRIARDTGKLSITRVTDLISGPPGVIAAVPIYKPGFPTTSVAERRKQLVGFMTAPIDVSGLISRSATIDTSEMSLIIRDIDATPASRLVYLRSASEARQRARSRINIKPSDLNPDAPYTNIDRLTVGNRRWELEYVPTARFVAGSLTSVDAILLMASLIIGFTTSGLVLLISGYTANIERDVHRRLQQLRSSEERTSRIIETAQDAFITMNRKGLVLEWNPQATATFGWSKAEALGQELASLIVPERLRDAHRRAMQRYTPNQPSRITGRRLEMPAVHRDGHELTVEMVITPALSNGELELHAFLHDVTERRVAEQERKHAAELKTHFVAMASHEMRTPLTSIIGYAQTLMARWDTLNDATKREFVGIIADQGERFGQLIEDLLTITQIEDGKLIARPERTNIAEAARQAIRDTEVAATVECPEDLHVMVSRNHLLQILVNFLRNAEKYGSVPIEIRAYPTDSIAVIEVRDSGQGVPPDFVPRLFERFAQADVRSTGKSRGVGLGLSIVEALAHAYRGTAWYRPNMPHGAVFGVTLPHDTTEDAASASSTADTPTE